MARTPESVERGSAMAPQRKNDIALTPSDAALVKAALAEEPGRFKPWVLRITTNIARDHLRKRKRRAMSIEDSRFDEKNIRGQQSGGLSREMMAAESRMQILDAIRSLPEGYELPMLMRYLEGLPYKDIATRLGVREDTLRKRVHRANMMLKDKLDKLIGDGD